MLQIKSFERVFFAPFWMSTEKVALFFPCRSARTSVFDPGGSLQKTAFSKGGSCCGKTCSNAIEHDRTVKCEATSGEQKCSASLKHGSYSETKAAE